MPRVPTERSFGLSVGSVCLLLGSLGWWRGSLTTAMVLVTIGAVLIVGGVLAPAALRLPNRLWWRFAHALGWINARVILTLFFFVALLPVGVVRRLFGRNPLRPTQAGTNWFPYAARRSDPRHYEHLF